jgi:hypothetical protein
MPSKQQPSKQQSWGHRPGSTSKITGKGKRSRGGSASGCAGKLGIDCDAAKQMLENAGGGDKLHRVMFRQLHKSYQQEEQREKVLESIAALAETSIAEAEAKAVLDSQQQAEEHAQALAVHARQLERAMAEAEVAKAELAHRTSASPTCWGR